jgi:hypothetical protein
MNNIGSISGLNVNFMKNCLGRGLYVNPELQRNNQVGNAGNRGNLHKPTQISDKITNPTVPGQISKTQDPPETFTLTPTKVSDVHVYPNYLSRNDLPPSDHSAGQDSIQVFTAASSTEDLLPDSDEPIPHPDISEEESNRLLDGTQKEI